jgi:hypothetical protein
VEFVYGLTYGDGLVMAGNDDRRVCTVQDEWLIIYYELLVCLSPDACICYGLLFQICIGGLVIVFEGYTFLCYELRDKEMVRD